MILKRRQAGYSLLETMVALAIIGLTASLVMPSLSAGLHSASKHTVVTSIAQQFLDWRIVAQRDGTARTLTATGLDSDANVLGVAVQLRPPAGVEALIQSSIVLSPDGTCVGGDILVRSETGWTHRLELDARTCRIRDK
jgi:prepilin-type N-terminal cleavage/methylation domain-containing protein